MFEDTSPGERIAPPDQVLEEFEGSKEYVQAEAMATALVEQFEADALQQISERYYENTYHNRTHTEIVIAHDLRNIEIAEQFPGLLGNPALAKLTAQLSGAAHDLVHYRRKPEVERGEVSPEDDSKQALREWVANHKELIIDQIKEDDALSSDAATTQQIFEIIVNRLITVSEKKIDVTKAAFRGMVEVGEEQFQQFCQEVSHGCEEGDIELFRKQFEIAPPSGEVKVLLIEQPWLTNQASIEEVSTAFADLKQGGKVPAEQFFKMGDGEFWELNRNLVEVLEHPDTQTTEELADATNKLLGWLDGQPGFLFAQWSDFEKKLTTTEVIVQHENAPEIMAAYRTEYGRFRENIHRCVTRAQNANTLFNGSTRDYTGKVAKEAFEGDYRTVMIDHLKKLYHEMKGGV